MSDQFENATRNEVPGGIAAEEAAHRQDVGAHSVYVKGLGGVAVAEQAVGDASYNFVFVEHSPELAPVIAAQLVDSGVDVLALEALDIKSGEDQAIYEKVYTALLSSKADEAGKQHIFSQLGNGQGEAFIRALLTSLSGTDMDVVLIDMAQDDPEYPKVRTATQKSLEYRQAIGANENNDALRGRLVADLRATAVASLAREDVMERKLGALQQKYAGKKVGPVVGRFHAPIADTRAQSSEVSSVFITSETDVSLEPSEQLSRFRVAREYGDDPDVEIDSPTLDRVLLGDVFYAYCANSAYGIDESSTMREEDEAQRQIDGFIGSMDDEQVSSLLAQADAIKHGRLARMAPDRTRQKVFVLLTDNLRRLSGEDHSLSSR